ncbi:MAG: ribonuclease protein component [Pseudomonadota bacterium]|nr:ribonuclease protein component [Pseudomonadota bacterium]MDQ5942620.1 ribonuclease protein component [Pseudomonadota bacterium]MDQ5959371.1 ribonuclease protein component [Pseudomonadota bacterium]
MSIDSQPAAIDAGGVTNGQQGFAFPKRYRLTKTDEYSSVFGFRRAVKSSHFLLHYRPRKQEEAEEGSPDNGVTARLGVVVPKRLVKAAVRRNLIKRIGREQFRQLLPKLPARDLILRLAVKPAKLDRKALAEEICNLLLKLNAPGR